MGTRKQVSARQPTTQDDIVLPEDEQWRIINNSGILHGVKRPSEPSLNDNDSDDERASEPHTAASTEHNREEGQIDDLFDNLFQAVLLIVPMCFLYAMMDLSVCNNPIARGRLAYHLARKACVECSMHSTLPSGRKSSRLFLSYQVCNPQESKSCARPHFSYLGAYLVISALVFYSVSSIFSPTLFLLDSLNRVCRQQPQGQASRTSHHVLHIDSSRDTPCLDCQ